MSSGPPASSLPWLITIDHTFLLTHPWHLFPLFVGVHLRPLAALKGVSLGIGKLPDWAFGPGLYDGVEFSMTTSQLFGRNEGRRWRVDKKLVERYRNAGWPTLAFHACFECPPIYFDHVRLDLTAEDPRVREGAAAQVEVVAMLGSQPSATGRTVRPVVVFHTGRVPASIPQRERRAVIKRVAANLRDAARLAETTGVRITVENLPRAFGAMEHLGSRRVEDLVEVLAGIGSDAAGVTFDYGHANTFCAEEPEYVERFLDVLGPHVEYAHLHYNGSHRAGFAETVDPRRFEYFDQHLPLTRIPDDEVERFAGHLAAVVDRTPVGRNRLVGLELPQRRVFNVKTILPSGATPEEQVESARILRGMLAELDAR
jgi:sugar phosphate isomerase/epimerase